MIRKRGTALLAVIGLLIAVIGLGVAYAAFSTTLTINGSATVEGTSWDVHFDKYIDRSGYHSVESYVNDIHGDSEVELEPYITKGNPIVITKPVISKTTFSGMKVKLTSPGDLICYVWNIHNNGNYDAKFKIPHSGNINMIKPICTSEDNNVSANKVCTYLKIFITTSENPQPYSELIIPAKDFTWVEIDISLNDITDPSLLPSVPVEVTIPEWTWTLEQDGTAKTN